MVPYSVQRPVTKVIENKVPVQRVQWVQEQHVRPVTVQRESYKLETVTEDVPVRTYTTERIVQKVKEPVRVATRVPVTETRMFPKVVTSRIPLTYYDPYASSIVDSYSSWKPLASPATITAEKPRPKGRKRKKQS